MPGNILVTGASGFIGANLLNSLLASGQPVICLVRRGQEIRAQPCRPGQLELVPFDHFSPEGLEVALSGYSFDVVYHLAAYGVRPSDRDWRKMVLVNVEASSALVGLAAAAGCRRFLFAGSSAEYAEQTSSAPLLENSPLETKRLYGSSKAAASLLISSLCEAHGISYAGLRFFNVYGPGEAPHRLLPSLVRGIASGEAIPLTSGTQVRDFVHVDDAVRALICAGDMLSSVSNSSGMYNCASGVGVSVRAFAEIAADLCGARAGKLEFGAKPLRPDELMFVVGDPTKFRSVSGWTCKIELREGIASTIAALDLKKRV